MPTNIIETPVKGTTIEVPIGTDKRKASSLMAAWQAIANRLKFLEDWHTVLNVLIEGGTLTPEDDVTVALTGGHLTFTGNTDYGIVLGTDTFLIANGRMRGALFAGAGGSGRANKRVQGTIAPVAASTTEVDASTFDHVWVNPGGDCNIQIENAPATAYVVGDHITVQNVSISTVDVKNPAGTTLIQLIGPSWCTMVLAEDGTTWRVGPFYLA